MDQEIKNYLNQLGFNKNEIKVYISLTKLGEATASQVAKKADLPRTTALSILNKMADKNFLTTHRYRGKTHYWIESPQIIVDIFESKKKMAGELGKMLSELYRAEAKFPFGNIYDTKSGIRNFIEKILTNTKKGSIIYTIDSPGEGNYPKIFSEKIGFSLSDIKKDKGIATHTLIPFGTFKTISKHKIESQNIKIKEMPDGIDFSASLWFVGDHMIHFSGNPPFIADIKHDSIVKSMKSIYDYLWSISIEKY